MVTSTTTGICSVSGLSLTLISAGSCNLTATQTGNSAYNVATPVTKTTTIRMIPIMNIFGRPYQNTSSTWYVPYTNSAREVAPNFNTLQIKLIGESDLTWTTISSTATCGLYGCGAIVSGYTNVCPQFRFVNISAGLITAIWIKSDSSGGTCT